MFYSFKSSSDFVWSAGGQVDLCVELPVSVEYVKRQSKVHWEGNIRYQGFQYIVGKMYRRQFFNTRKINFICYSKITPLSSVDSKSLLTIFKWKESYLTMYEIIFVHTQFESLNTYTYLFIAQVCTRYIPLDIVLLSIPYLAFVLYECHTWLIRDSVLYH